MIDNDYFNSTQDYLTFYGLADTVVGCELLPLESGGFKLAGHIFKPPEYKAVVIIIHGYLGHSGLMNKLIRFLTAAGFAVAAFDLPGHGLSSGPRTAIDDFSQYSDALRDFLNIVKAKLHGPYHIIGFSTGAAAVMDYFFAGQADCFDKVILAAPLVRNERWYISKLAYQVSRPFSPTVPRVFRKVSGDEDFLKFIHYIDPMSAKSIAIKWAGALFRWNKKIAGMPVSDRLIKIIQGTKDDIVAWRYNLKFIQSKFKRAEIELIENGRHELFNESEKIRNEVFSSIGEYLKDSH